MARVITDADLVGEGSRLLEWAAQGEDTMILAANAEPLAVVLSFDRYKVYQRYQQWTERLELFRRLEELATDNPNGIEQEDEAIELVNEERRSMYRKRGDNQK